MKLKKSILYLFLMCVFMLTGSATASSIDITTMTSSDIGNVGSEGSSIITTDSIIIFGSGNDIWGTNDAFHYVYHQLNGNGSLVTRVAEMDNTDSWAKVGIMIRETLDSDSPHAMAFITPERGISLAYRLTKGGDSARHNLTAGTTPYWLKLERNDDVFSAYKSINGTDWEAVGEITLSISESAYIGLAVTSHAHSKLNTTTFDNILLTEQTSNQLESTDIGDAPIAGSTSQNDDEAIVSSSGDTIWGQSDSFRYAYLPLNRNGSLVTKVTDITNTHDWAKAGIMIRETLDNDSPHAMAFVTSGKGISFQYRITKGGNSARKDLFSGSAPYWLKLERRNQTFTAYKSVNGTDWDTMGEISIPMQESVYIGLAVSAGNSDQLNTSVFNNISLSTTDAPADDVDVHEENDTMAQAKDIPENDIQEHNFFDDPVDWVKFSAIAGVEYNLITWTTGQTNTIITLYGAAEQVLASNDDKAAGELGSRILWTAPSDGTYYLKIESYAGVYGENQKYTVQIGNNDPPVAINQTVYLHSMTETNVTLTGSDANYDPLSFQIVTQPTKGIISGTAPDLIYTPNQDFTGSDHFSFVVSDGKDTSKIGTVLFTEPHTNAPVKVFILAGQSNMLGYGEVSENLPHVDHLPKLTAEDPATYGKYWTKRNDVWVCMPNRNPGELKIGFAANRERNLGPELSLGHEFGDHFAEEVLFIKVSVGGTTLAEDWLPPSAVDQPDEVMGPLYAEMVAYVNDVLTNIGDYWPAYQGQGYDIGGFIWLQGWNDMLKPDFLSIYEENLMALVSDVRSEFGIPDLPVMIMDSPNDGVSANHLALAQAKQNAVVRLNDIHAGSAVYVSTDATTGFWDPSGWGPSFHFNLSAKTYIKVGNAGAAAFLPLVQ